LTGTINVAGSGGFRSKTINIPEHRRGRWLVTMSKINPKATMNKIAKTVKDISGTDIKEETDNAADSMMEGVNSVINPGVSDEEVKYNDEVMAAAMDL